MSYGTLSGGRGGMGSPYSDLEGGVGSWGFKVPSVVRNPIAILSKPMAALPMLTKPVDRFIPGPLMRMIPGGGATMLTAMAGNPLLAARAVQLKLRPPTAHPAGYQPVPQSQTSSAVRSTYSGLCLIAPGTPWSGAAWKILSVWRSDDSSAVRIPGWRQHIVPCQLYDDGTLVPNSIAALGPVNGLGELGWGFSAPRIFRAPVAAITRPLAAVYNPVGRFIPKPITNRLPFNRFMAPRPGTAPVRQVWAITGAAYPGKCLLTPGSPQSGAAWHLVTSWRTDNPPGSMPPIGARDTIVDCQVYASGSLVPNSIAIGGTVSGLGIIPAPTSMPISDGPPADATKVAEGFVVDMHRGDIWIGPTKVAILPAVFSAIAVKVILFGGSYAGNKARDVLSRRKAATA